MTFVGCKLALIHGPLILTYLRDDRPGLPWAGLWDLSGGGREGQETPEACVLREARAKLRAISSTNSCVSCASRLRAYSGLVSARILARFAFVSLSRYWSSTAL